jgi:hypothetical protein
MRRLVLLLSVLVAASVPLSPADSQAAPARAPKPLGESLTGRAREAYRSAELLFNGGDYRGSITKYQQAYDLSHDARLFLDMALAAKGLHQYAQMKRWLERYEGDMGDALAARDRAAAEAALAAIRNLVGSVTLTANVSGASISIDDEVVGTTPLPGPVTLDLGSHTIVAAKSGYPRWTKKLDIAGGDELNVALELVAEVPTAELLVISEADATITVDNKAIATERFDGAVAPGVHEVRVTAPGKAPYRAQVELREKEARTLQVTLLAEHGPAPVWPWIVGGVAVAAGLGVGGYFLFRSQDTTAAVPPGAINVKLM